MPIAVTDFGGSDPNLGTQIAGAVPFLGEFILKALRGGPDLSALTLQRFFAAHIWIIPAALAGLAEGA